MKYLINQAVLKFILRSRLNIWLGKTFFYNSGGLVSNLIGSYIKRRDPKESKRVGFQYKTNEKVSSLKEQGFLQVGNIGNQETIQDLAKLWNEYTKKKAEPKDGRLELSSADKNEEKILSKFAPLLKDLVTEDIQSFLESYFGSYSRIVNYHIYRNRKPPNVNELESYGSTANWHNDGSTSESIKLFFMLSDVTKDNGPMEVLSINDSRDVFKSNHFFFPDLEGMTKDFINKNSQKVSLQGKAGCLFYALTNDILHRATIPNEGAYRDLIVFYITSSSKKRSVDQQLKEAKFREIYGLKRLFIN